MPPPMADEMPQPVTDYGPGPAAASVPDNDLSAPTPAAEVAPAPYAPPVHEAAPLPARAAEQVAPPAAKRYDSQEVIKKIREYDRSRSIGTTEVVPSYAPPREAYAPSRRASHRPYIRPDVTLVNFVVQRYRVIQAPELLPAAETGGYRPIYWSERPHRTACSYGRYGRTDSCRPLLRVRG
jgi:hypothetical protein